MAEHDPPTVAPPPLMVPRVSIDRVLPPLQPVWRGNPRPRAQLEPVPAPDVQPVAVKDVCPAYDPPPIDMTKLDDAVGEVIKDGYPTPPRRPILPLPASPSLKKKHPIPHFGGPPGVFGLHESSLVAAAVIPDIGAALPSSTIDEELQDLTMTMYREWCKNDADPAKCVQKIIAAEWAAYEVKLAAFTKAHNKWASEKASIALEMSLLQQKFCEWLDMVYMAIPASDLATTADLSKLPVVIPYGTVPDPPVGYTLLARKIGNFKGTLTCKTSAGKSYDTLVWTIRRLVTCFAGTMQPVQLAKGTKPAWYLFFRFSKSSRDFYDTYIKPKLDKPYLRLALAPAWQTMLFGRQWNNTFDLTQKQPQLHDDTWVQMIPYFGWGYGDLEKTTISWGPTLRTSLQLLQEKAASLSETKPGPLPTGQNKEAVALWVLPWGCQVTTATSDLGKIANATINVPPEELLWAVRKIVKRNDNKPPNWANKDSRFGDAILSDWPVPQTGGTFDFPPPSRRKMQSTKVKLAKFATSTTAPGLTLVSFTPKSLEARIALLKPAAWLSTWFMKFVGNKWIPSMMPGSNLKKVCGYSWTPTTKPIAWPWWWALSAPEASFLHIPFDCLPGAPPKACLLFNQDCVGQANLANNKSKMPTTTTPGSSFAPFPCIYFD